jgi:uncharacterized protein (TIGR03067 family)
MLTRVVVGAVIYLVAIGPVGADSPRDQEEFRAVETLKLEGEWATNRVYLDEGGIVEVQLNSGKPFIELVFEGDHFTLMLAGQKQRGTCSAYLVKGSGEIDLTSTTGKQKGIFRFDGGDTLILCLAEAGKDRPTEFESKNESGHVFLKLNRQKP